MEITIIGKGRGWKDAPEQGETWGVNDLCYRRDVKLVFNMHDFDKYSDIIAMVKSKEYVNRTNVPMIGLKKRPDIPSLIEFPIKEMHTDYFTNSVSYMIAYAIYKGATKIDMYGCAMATGTEYEQQKPNVEYWMGYARGLGIKVTIQGSSTLLRAHNALKYGYEEIQEKR